ncbi:hypothetical protein PR048_019852 [Dryococelus australis]|uniref:Uncharacterized protein n=1 Tax=Dryococelus australis TaxID=614101 RepID=A0ABQ9H4V7_9NEOP|nr:hypothetical protein PR048_019852 [Dryococelus australis]
MRTGGCWYVSEDMPHCHVRRIGYGSCRETSRLVSTGPKSDYYGRLQKKDGIVGAPISDVAFEEADVLAPLLGEHTMNSHGEVCCMGNGIRSGAELVEDLRFRSLFAHGSRIVAVHNRNTHDSASIVAWIRKVIGGHPCVVMVVTQPDSAERMLSVVGQLAARGFNWAGRPRSAHARSRGRECTTRAARGLPVAGSASRQPRVAYAHARRPNTLTLATPASCSSSSRCVWCLLASSSSCASSRETATVDFARVRSAAVIVKPIQYVWEEVVAKGRFILVEAPRSSNREVAESPSITIVVRVFELSYINNVSVKRLAGNRAAQSGVTGGRVVRFHGTLSTGGGPTKRADYKEPPPSSSRYLAHPEVVPDVPGPPLEFRQTTPGVRSCMYLRAQVAWQEGGWHLYIGHHDDTSSPFNAVTPVCGTVATHPTGSAECREEHCRGSVRLRVMLLVLHAAKYGCGHPGSAGLHRFASVERTVNITVFSRDAEQRYERRCGGKVVIMTALPDEPGSIPNWAAPGFSHVGIVPNDVAGRRVFSGISHFPRTCIPIVFNSHLNSPASALKTSTAGCNIMKWLRSVAVSSFAAVLWAVGESLGGCMTHSKALPTPYTAPTSVHRDCPPWRASKRVPKLSYTNQALCLQVNVCASLGNRKCHSRTLAQPIEEEDSFQDTAYPISDSAFTPASVDPSVAGNGAAGRCCWSAGFLRNLPFIPCIPALRHTHLASSSSALKTSLLRAAQISPLHSKAYCFFVRLSFDDHPNCRAFPGGDLALYRNYGNSGPRYGSYRKRLPEWSTTDRSSRPPTQEASRRAATFHYTKRSCWWIRGGGNERSPRKPTDQLHRTTIPTCENPGVTPSEIEPSSPSNCAPVHNVCSVVVTQLESRRATSCGYNSSHPVWHVLYECLQDIHGDSSPFLLQPFHELSYGFWPRLTISHPAIQFVPKTFYRVEVGALGGPVQSANIVASVFMLPRTNTRGPTSKAVKQPRTINPPPSNFLVGTIHSGRSRSPGRRHTHTRPSDRNDVNLDSLLHRTDFHCSSVQLRRSKHHLSRRALLLVVVWGLCAAALPKYPSRCASVRNVPMETDTPVAA